MPKKFFIFSVIFNLCLIAVLPLRGFCEKKPTISLALTGDVSGQIYPAKKCGPKPSMEGGFARRATIVDIIRKTEPDLLMLDAGNIMLKTRTYNLDVNARISLKSMDMMGYAAMNVGPQDLRLGPEFIEENSRDLSLELISSNIVYKENGEHLFKPWIVKEIKGMKIGIFGIVPANGLALLATENATGISAIEIIDPEKAVEDTLKTLEDKSDFIVLLSLLDPQANLKILERFGKIDMLVSSDKLVDPNDESFVKPRRYMTAAYRGTRLLYLRIGFPNDSSAPEFITRNLTLSDVVEENREIDQMMRKEYSAKSQKNRLERLRKRNEALHEMLSDNLKLSPAEYLRSIHNEEQKGENVK